MVYYIQEPDTGAISNGYAGPSFSYLTEHPVALAIKPSTKDLVDTASLHLVCDAPDLIEPITANSLPPRVTVGHDGPNPGNFSLLLYPDLAILSS